MNDLMNRRKLTLDDVNKKLDDVGSLMLNILLLVVLLAASVVTICVIIWLVLFMFSHTAQAESLVPGTVLYAAHTEGELKIRETPWGDRVGYLYPGDDVVYIESKDGWTHVACSIESGGGWVKSEYLSTELVKVELNPTGEYRNSSGGRMHLRKSPRGDHVRWIEAGEVVEVIKWTVDSEGVQWAYTGGGYASGDCLEGVSVE